MRIGLFGAGVLSVLAGAAAAQEPARYPESRNWYADDGYARDRDDRVYHRQERVYRAPPWSGSYGGQASAAATWSAYRGGEVRDRAYAYRHEDARWSDRDCRCGPPVHVRPAPVYRRPAPVYVERRPVYVERPPVYVSAPPVYVSAPPVYIEQPPIYVQGPAVHVQAPPVYVDSPVVHVTPGPVHVTPGEVHVRPPEVVHETPPPPPTHFGDLPPPDHVAPVAPPRHNYRQEPGERG